MVSEKLIVELWVCERVGEEFALNFIKTYSKLKGGSLGSWAIGTI